MLSFSGILCSYSNRTKSNFFDTIITITINKIEIIKPPTKKEFQNSIEYKLKKFNLKNREITKNPQILDVLTIKINLSLILSDCLLIFRKILIIIVLIIDTE
jgi:hypothetical protein